MNHACHANHPFNALRAHLARGAESRSTPLILVQIEELAEAYVIQAALPGFSKEQASIDVDGSRLTIRASREEAPRNPEAKILYSDQMFGKAQRIIDLPQEVNAQEVSATLSDGILKISAPKLNARKRSIAIS